MAKRFDIKTTQQLIAELKQPKAHDVVDGMGLYIATTGAPKRAGSWRYAFKSPVTGNRTKMTLGTCWVDPEGRELLGMGLSEARAKHNEARELVEAGIDPVMARDDALAKLRAEQQAKADIEADNKRRKLQGLPVKDSFRDVAQRLHAENVTRHDDTTRRQFELVLEKWAHPLIGDKHVNDVTPQDVMAIDELLVKEGKRQTLVLVRRFIRQVMDYAIHPKRGLRQGANPVFVDKTLWDGMRKRPQPAATKPDDCALVMRTIWAWEPASHGNLTVKRAMIHMALTAQRSATVAKALKSEFDLDAGVWTIPAPKMKGRRLLKEAPDAKPHTVYLSRQAVANLRAQFEAFPDSPYAFPGQGRAEGSCMGHGSVSERLGKKGFGFQGLHTGHGFRAMMRTVCTQHLGCNPLHLEHVLGHKNAIRGLDVMLEVSKMLDGGMGNTYDRSTYDEQRAQVMQRWADYVDSLVRPKLALAA